MKRALDWFICASAVAFMAYLILGCLGLRFEWLGWSGVPGLVIGRARA